MPNTLGSQPRTPVPVCLHTRHLQNALCLQYRQQHRRKLCVVKKATAADVYGLSDQPQQTAEGASKAAAVAAEDVPHNGTVAAAAAPPAEQTSVASPVSWEGTSTGEDADWVGAKPFSWRDIDWGRFSLSKLAAGVLYTHTHTWCSHACSRGEQNDVCRSTAEFVLVIALTVLCPIHNSSQQPKKQENTFTNYMHVVWCTLQALPASWGASCCCRLEHTGSSTTSVSGHWSLHVAADRSIQHHNSFVILAASIDLTLQ